MAQAPSDQEINKTTQESELEEKSKLDAQKQQGKDFINNGQGVIPEEVWQNLPGKRVDANG